MKKFIGLVVCLLFLANNASAVDLGLGVKAGINGIGLDVSLGLTKNINARISYASLDIEGEDETVTVGDDGAEGDIDAELDFDYGASALFIDWHVLGGGFRISAGLFKNNGEADLDGDLQSGVVIDGQALDPSDINGSIGGNVSLGDSYQPYIGIGWGRGAGGDGGLSFSADIGVALLDIDVDFDASVNAGGANGLNQAELNERLANAEKDAEDELDEYELWPVIAFGVNYAF